MRAESSRKIPGKCQECAKLSTVKVHSGCDFCLDLGYHEDIFCDLNRSVQSHFSFKCYAFQPILRLVGGLKPAKMILPKSFPGSSLREVFQGLLDPDKVKYQLALARQKLSLDPDSVFFDIKYHFAWSVALRNSVFKPADDLFDFMRIIFDQCGERIGCVVSLVWLGPDHLHLYVEANVDKSADMLAQDIKNYTTLPILKEFAKLGVCWKGDYELWDKSYFVETIS